MECYLGTGMLLYTTMIAWKGRKMENNKGKGQEKNDHTFYFILFSSGFLFYYFPFLSSYVPSNHDTFPSIIPLQFPRSLQNHIIQQRRHYLIKAIPMALGLVMDSLYKNLGCL